MTCGDSVCCPSESWYPFRLSSAAWRWEVKRPQRRFASSMTVTVVCALLLVVLCICSATRTLPELPEDLRPRGYRTREFGLFGDVIISSLFPIFNMDLDFRCERFRTLFVLSHTEPFLFLLRKRNFTLAAETPRGRPIHVDLGFTVRDMCVGYITPIDFSLVMADFSPAQAICSFERAEREFIFAKAEITSRSLRPVVAMIGPTNSIQSSVTAPLLSAYNVVQVSPAASSDEFACHLSASDQCKSDFEYFFRTVSTDHAQAFAVADLLNHFGWNYTVVIHSYEFLGLKNKFSSRAKDHNICIQFTFDFADEFQALSIIKKLHAFKSLRVIVLFAHEGKALTFFDELVKFCMGRERSLGDECVPRVFVGNDAWGYLAEKTLSEELYYNASLDTILFFRPEVPPHFKEMASSLQNQFYHFIQSLTGDILRRVYVDPWMCKEFEAINECTGVCELNLTAPNSCGGSRRFPEKIFNRFLLQEAAYQPTLLATEAVIAALENLLQEFVDLNPNKPETFFRAQFANFAFGRRLLDAVQNVRLPCSGLGVNKSLCPLFPKDWHEVQPAYSIVASDFVHMMTVVGHWELNSADSGDVKDGQIVIESAKVRWPRESLGATSRAPPPESDCDMECGNGVGKKRVLGTCCYSCDRCSHNQVSNGSVPCKACEKGLGAAQNGTECEPLPERGPGMITRFVLGAISIGLAILVIATLAIYVYKRRSPVIRSDFQLTVTLLGSLFLIVVAGAVDLVTPTLTVCIARRVLSTPTVLISVTVVFVKTSRLARIGLKAGRMRGVNMNWSLGTSAQVVFIATLTSIGTLVDLVHIGVSPPHPELRFFSEENLVLCPVHTGITVALDVYILLIILATSALAFMIRKLPLNVKEAWHLFLCGFSLSTSWVALRIVFYLSSNETQVILECLHFLAHVGIIWLWLFVPRLNIIIIHPEKNVRSIPKSMRLTGTLTSLSRTQSWRTASATKDLASSSSMLNHPLNPVCNATSLPSLPEDPQSPVTILTTF